MRRPSPLLPLHPNSIGGKARKRQDIATNVKRTLLLAGIATALIFGALSWKRLGDTHGKQQFTEVTRDASARVLRETEELRASGGDMFVHSHGGHAEPEPCGESCSKDHAHTLPVHAQEGAAQQSPDVVMGSALYRMSVADIDGVERSMREFAGKVLLVTNVASECGFTKSNYEGLQQLYDKYRGRGFEVLAFPCNQFGNQEPGDALSIKEFAKKRYGVTFPIFKKVEVNGDRAHPIMKFLKMVDAADGSSQFANWNFNKYLVDRRGFPVKHYGSEFNAAELEAAIEEQLSKQEPRPAVSTASQ